MFFMKVISWNCRGAGSSPFCRNVHKLIFDYKLDILILLETRVPSNRAVQVSNFGNFEEFVCVEAKGYSGGIWIFWRTRTVNLELLTLNDQVISIGVVPGQKIEWVSTAMYVSPLEKYRKERWNYLGQIGPHIQLPWLLLGDFNQVLYEEEKVGG